MSAESRATWAGTDYGLSDTSSGYGRGDVERFKVDLAWGMAGNTVWRLSFNGFHAWGHREALDAPFYNGLIAVSLKTTSITHGEVSEARAFDYTVPWVRVKEPTMAP